MTSRARILASIRTGLATGAPASTAIERQRRTEVARHLEQRAPHLVPARVAGKPAAELPAVLRHWLEAAGGEMIEVASTTAVPATVADCLARHGQPPRVRIGADPLLESLPWTSVPALTVMHGRAAAADTASLTRAVAAVAETGTLLVASGPANPVTLSFLPETNLVLVSRAGIVGPLEEALDRVRAQGPLPRTLNLISGPSRSADIGGVPVLGAHGPRRLCAIVVG